MWIFFTLLAATMQSFRNAFQSELSKEVNTLGVTLARFIWASPIALIYLAGLYQWQPASIANFNIDFSLFVISASLLQILATSLMVQLFKRKNFTVGAGLAKSEALVAAVLGVLFLGTHLSLLGWIGVAIGGVAVFMLSSGHSLKSLSPSTVLIGLSCGASFALTSLFVREASLSLDLSIPFTHRAATVLFCVITLQTLILLSYLAIKHRAVILDLWQRPKLTVYTSVASCLGSIGWFSAMSLQTVPYVKTLGQIEIFITMLVALFYLKEKVKHNDMLALVLIALAAVMVMWA